MRWFKPNFRSGLQAIFSSSHGSVPPQDASEYSIEDIRDAMLTMLAEVGEDRSPQVTRRIRYAVDVQALWFLRGDLMAVLSGAHGEAVALEKLEALSQMFKALLPQGLRSRPSPLSGGTKG
jgi:hypothetical protein